MIIVEAEIVFAAPDHFHRLAEFLRKQRGFHHIIRL